MATSRLLMRSDSRPIAIPAASVKPTRPHSGARPIRPAPVAPANPICDSAWLAKVCPRITRKKPTMPDTTATMPAAAKALFMNSYWNMSVMVMLVAVVLMHVIGALDVEAVRHHEDVAFGAHHPDVGAVQTRKHRRGHHVVDRAQHRLLVAEIEHAVERSQQLIEFVRAEQHGN